MRTLHCSSVSVCVGRHIYYRCDFTITLCMMSYCSIDSDTACFYRSDSKLCPSAGMKDYISHTEIFKQDNEQGRS